MRKIIAFVFLYPIYYNWLRKELSKRTDLTSNLHWSERIIYDWGLQDNRGYWQKKIDDLWDLEFDKALERANA